MTRGIEKLTQYRNRIDIIDHNIIRLVKKRFSIVRRVGMWKQKHSLSIVDWKRYREMLSKKMKQARLFGISYVFIKKLFSHIHVESVKIQKACIRFSTESKNKKQ